MTEPDATNLQVKPKILYSSPTRYRAPDTLLAFLDAV